MFKRSHFVIAIFGVLALGLVACSNGSTTEVAPPTSTSAAATAQPTQPSTQATAETATPASTQAPAVVSTQAPVSAETPISLSSVTNAGRPADVVALRPASEELPTVEVVKILTPSVVQVVTETVLSMGAFNQPVPSTGVGTGVILDTDGNILTNNHVVDGANTITVTLSNGDSFLAEVIGQDISTDLAIIRIDAKGLQPAKLGFSSALQVGEDVIAIGHALGLPGGPSVSKGVVSALGRSIDTDNQNTIVDLIQTDASINPGNSGGPLVNNRAEVIGINTAIIRGSQGIGFSINIDDAKVVAEQLMERGYVDRGFIGITPINLSPSLARQVRVPVTEGILVARVIFSTAASKAGLQQGDVIVEMGGEPIANTGELSKFLIANPPGEEIEIVFFRGSDRLSATVILGTRPTR
ncbi:MAG: trypsin-like peptidase domain-containing protein [Chloroflexi bacterium]|nr:trypsin-like peptidase domain-containing protein [Chloroflexota bacterium]